MAGFNVLLMGDGLEELVEKGLDSRRILADIQQAVADGLIPASRQGERDVRAEFVLYVLYLGGVHGPTNLYGWLKYYDARSGAPLGSTRVIVPNRTQFDRVPYNGGNMVRNYNVLLDLLEEAVPLYLPQ